MKLIFLFLTFIISVVTCLSQSIYFPALGDGAQNPKAKFGYLDGVPVEIRAKNIDTIFSDNGNIIEVESQGYNYEVKPKNTGLLNIFLVTNSGGLLDTTTSSITVVNRPELRLVVHKQDDLFILNLIDENDNVVTSKFNCALEIGYVSDKNATGLFLYEWQGGLTLKDIISDKFRNEIGLKGLTFNTTAVYSKEYGLYTGTYNCSIKIKN